MREATIICNDYIGDSIFASSAVEQLKLQNVYDVVNFHIRFSQPLELFQANPNIGDVRLIGTKTPTGEIFTIPRTTWEETPPLQFQKFCGVSNPTSEYKVYVPEYAKREAFDYIQPIKDEYIGIPIIAWQANWWERSFFFTEEEYEIAYNTPDIGYGKCRRDINYIINRLGEKFVMIRIGLDNGVKQHDPRTSVKSYTKDAAIIEQCDWLIGPEGGMTNLGAGLRTKCIITTDLIYQLYGPRGLMKQNPDPQMGPAKLFPSGGHTHLNPFLTDEQVVQEIEKIVS